MGHILFVDYLVEYFDDVGTYGFTECGRLIARYGFTRRLFYWWFFLVGCSNGSSVSSLADFCSFLETMGFLGYGRGILPGIGSSSSLCCSGCRR